MLWYSEVRYGVAGCGMVVYGVMWDCVSWYVVWDGLVLYGVVWYEMDFLFCYSVVWNRIVRRVVVWNFVVELGMVCCGMMWYGMVWCGLACFCWHCTVLCGMIWYMVWFIRVWYGMI
jgi:chloride channel 2